MLPGPTHDLVEIQSLDPSIKLDLRYATSDNFVGKAVYPSAHAFLQRVAAKALIQVHQGLKPQGLGLLIFDAYRPWSVTELFWNSVRPEHRRFVANPETGSRHNRGCAVDLSLYELRSGRELEMPSPFDDFTEKSAIDYAGGPLSARKNRQTLFDAMTAAGFAVYPYEWWHYDHPDWQQYPILDVSFQEILTAER